MSSPNPKCPKCQSAMEEGFIPDHEGRSSARVRYWMAGPPDKRWWGLNTKGREKLMVMTFRCTRCGFLESYTVSPEE